MSNKEHLHNLIDEIGPLLEIGEVSEFESENLWTLVFDEDTVLFVDYDEEQGDVTLSGDVATVDATRSAQAYERLLQYNNQWEQTGGIRFALDGPGPEGTVVQIVNFGTMNLDLVSLQTIVTNFLGLLRSWRSMLTAEQLGNGSSASEAMPNGAIRA